MHLTRLPLGDSKVVPTPLPTRVNATIDHLSVGRAGGGKARAVGALLQVVCL